MTGIVHWFLLRPLLDLEGLRYLTDVLLHVVVPILAVLGWLLFGPRPRVTLRIIRLSLVWPITWVIVTFAIGAVTGWYPYLFLDVGVRGVPAVAGAVLAITVGYLFIAGLLWLGDRKLPAGPTKSAVLVAPEADAPS